VGTLGCFHLRDDDRDRQVRRTEARLRTCILSNLAGQLAFGSFSAALRED